MSSASIVLSDPDSLTLNIIEQGKYLVASLIEHPYTIRFIAGTPGQKQTLTYAIYKLFTELHTRSPLPAPATEYDADLRVQLLTDLLYDARADLNAIRTAALNKLAEDQYPIPFDSVAAGLQAKEDMIESARLDREIDG